MLVVSLKKLTLTQKLMKLKRKLLNIVNDKYITTPEFNQLTAENFAARLAQANLITKTDFNAKLSSLNEKITSNKTKHLLVENELKKLERFDSIYFCGKSHFEDDGTQNYLVFQTVYRYFKTIRIVIFYHGNLKDCLMKVLSLLLHLIKCLILQ